MSYACEVLADSISDQGHRLTTMCVTFPRFILAEMNTWRMSAKNSASSRAVPIWRSIQQVQNNPFIPVSFGRNRSGMSWEESLTDVETHAALAIWRRICVASTMSAQGLAELEVHKSLGNRILEPYKWHTAIVTATEWSNFFALRTAPNAQPEFREIALMMQEAYDASNPKLRRPGEWHLPSVSQEELASVPAPLGPGPSILIFRPHWDHWKEVAIGRIARVSFERHGEKDTAGDVNRHDKLLDDRHMSPFEQVARPFSQQEWNLVRSLQEWTEYQVLTRADEIDPRHAKYLARHLEFQGCLRGWHSARMDVENEHDFSLVTAA